MHNDYYVYLHRRGDNNEVFYVGKGRRNRAKSKHGRNKWWTAIVNKHGFTVEYVEKGLSEESAFDLEIELIKFYRDNSHTLCNISCGGEGASGCTRTEEHKQALSRAHKGKVTPEDVKLKMAEQGKTVYCSNGMSFVSMKRAAAWLTETLGRTAYPTSVSLCCRGKAAHAYGYKWSFEDVF